MIHHAHQTIGQILETDDRVGFGQVTNDGENTAIDDDVAEGGNALDAQ